MILRHLWLLYYVSVILSVHITTAIFCAHKSRTFLKPRGFTSDATLIHTASTYRLLHNRYDTPYSGFKKPFFTAQTSYFYEESNNRFSLARYFFPCGNRQLAINEDGSGNIGSPWLGLFGTHDQMFAALVDLEPSRKAYGAVNRFHFNLEQYVPRCWLHIITCAAYVEHDLDFFERLRGPEGQRCPIRRVTDALNNQSWRYGLVPLKRQGLTGYDDVLMRIGYTFSDTTTRQIALYGQWTLPMGQKPAGRMLFEPLIGNGGHTGLGLGLSAYLTLWHYNQHILSFLLDWSYVYLFSATERRIFDLCHGEWSRYIQLAHAQTPSIPCAGINFLAQDVKVHPRDSFDSWCAVHYAYDVFNLELAVNLWWRNSEDLRGKFYIPSDVGVFDLSNEQTSSSQGTICQTNQGPCAAPSDEVFVPLTCADINRESARGRSASSVKVALSIGMQSCFFGKPSLFSLGGAYEIPHDNAGLEQWVVWIKTNLTF